MKKLIALALAALMLLAPAALAEYADAFPAVTVTGALTVDRDAARAAMESAGVPENEIKLWDGLLALLSDTRDRLVIADEGIEYSLTGTDGTTMFVAGETRDGRVAIVSSLFPGTVLTGEASGKDWTEIAAAADAVVDAVNRAMDAVAAAAEPDAPVPGSYEIDGEVFDARAPLNIDARAMAEAGAALARELIANETLREAGLDALSGYAGIQVDPASLPAVSAAKYSADGTGVTLYTAELTRAGEPAQTVLATVREDGENIRVKVSALDQTLELAAEYAPTGDGVRLTANVRYDGNDYALTVDMQSGETATMTTALYFGGMDAPLATEVNTFALNGARTVAVDAEGKTALALADVANDNGGARTKLLADMILGGLPELSGLLGN